MNRRNPHRNRSICFNSALVQEFFRTSPTLLRKMRRPGQVERTLERIKSWREQVPNLTIRSTFIVGFPGETNAEFEELLQWLDVAQLDRVGCFKYSPVDGATANALPGAVAPEVMDERYARFMEKAATISEARMVAKVGREITVLVDSVDGSKALARTPGDAPEIDGVVNVKKAKDLKPGEFARVKITTAGTYDLAAEPI